MFASIDWLNPTGDLFVLSLFAAGIMLTIVCRLRERAVSIMAALYVAYAIASALPQDILRMIGSSLGADRGYLAPLGLFLTLFLGFFIAADRIIGVRMDGRRSGVWWKVFLYAFVQTGVVLAMTLSFFPKEVIATSMPLTHSLFLFGWTTFGWLLAFPIVVALFSI